jgi:Zinc-binding dehydrogenase
MIRHLSALIGSGEFTPLIDRRYPLDRIPEAHRYVETGQKIGNVVIVVRPTAEGMVARFPPHLPVVQPWLSAPHPGSGRAVRRTTRLRLVRADRAGSQLEHPERTCVALNGRSANPSAA